VGDYFNDRAYMLLPVISKASHLWKILYFSQLSMMLFPR